MRTASENLMKRSVLGRDVFARGAPEPLAVRHQARICDNLIDLLKAYAERRQKKMRRQVYTIKSASPPGRSRKRAPRWSAWWA
jgi:segregation and condensation protein A